MSNDRFHRILVELGDLHDRKNADYGTMEDPLYNFRGALMWGLKPWIGAMIRLGDKIQRLSRLARDGKLTNETAIDTFNDAANYAILGRILFEEEQQRPKEKACIAGQS